MGIKGLLKALNPLLVPAEGSTNSGGGGSTNLNAHPNGGQIPNGKYHIGAFARTTLAVDASSWLYKAGYACADQLVESIETPPTPNGASRLPPQVEAVLSSYFQKRIDHLLASQSIGGGSVAGVILVFDGRRCPLKAGTNAEREARRRSNLAEARRLRALGRMQEARDKYKQCIKATDSMARSVAAGVEKKYKVTGPNHFGALPKVRCVFAPYEADAQLAKLCADGVADAVVTEDSDILVYSAAVGVAFPVIYKLDRDTGLCDVVSMDWLLSASSASQSSGDGTTGAARDAAKPKPLGESRRVDRLAPVRRYLPAYGDGDKTKSSSSKKKGKGGGADGPMLSTLRSMVHLEERKAGAGRRAFVQSCVLAGCDYAPSLVAGVGTVGAFRKVQENRNREESVRFRRILMPFRGKIAAYAEEEEEAAEETSEGGHDGEDGPNESQSSVSTQKKSKKSRRDQEMDNLNVYENLLAKSEAVFYYHCVLNVSDGSIGNLTEPQETVPGEVGNASAAATAAKRRSRLSADSLSDGEDDASTTTAGSVAPPGDPRKYHPSTKRFEGDISFVGSLDVAVNASGTIFPAATARRAITKTPLSSLTRTPSAGPVSNPYARGPASAPPATSMVRVREKTSKGSPTIDALFSAAAAKKSPNAGETRQRQGSGGSTANASGNGASSNNMFAGFAHGDAKKSNANAEDDVVHVDDSDSDDDGETDAPAQAAKASEPDDPTATSRHFTSKSTTGENRKVSFDSPEKEDDAAEAACSPCPAKKTRKDADKSPASDGSGFWSDGDKDDCIVVEEPPPKSSSKTQTSSNGMSFAAAHQSHSGAAPDKGRGGKENSSSTETASSGFISVFRSSQMDRMPRGSSKKSKSGSGKKSKKQQQKRNSGSGGLLEGFERQKKNAAADGSAVIKESLEDRKRRLSNASRRSSASSSTSIGGGAKKRKSAPKVSSFFNPLDVATKPTRKSF